MPAMKASSRDWGVGARCRGEVMGRDRRDVRGRDRRDVRGQSRDIFQAAWSSDGEVAPAENVVGIRILSVATIATGSTLLVPTHGDRAATQIGC